MLVKALRWIRILRTTHRALFGGSKTFQKALKAIQAEQSNLKGYRDDEYDLDIAYITDHICIMSRPATTALQQFNHDALEDVKTFLDEKHSEHYRIYDLCVYDQDEDKVCEGVPWYVMRCK